MTVLGYILFLAAGLGHAAVLIYILNWCYGTPTPHQILFMIRRFLMIVGLVGLVLFWQVFGLDMSGLRYETPILTLRSLLVWYTWACVAISLGYLPIVTLRRLAYHPRPLLTNHTHTVDVVAALGHRPLGRGKHLWLAKLPGNDLFHVDFSEKEIELPRLPAAWDGLTILHLSDFHMTGVPAREHYQHLMRLCCEPEPDILAITGDTVDGPAQHRWIIPVLGHLHWRISAFAILGNHESWYDPNLVRRRIGKLGIRVIGNQWQQITVRDEPMIVIGNEAPWFRPKPDLSSCPSSIFRLCLSHTPDNIRWAQRHQIDLMLSGHNHGGQIRFPMVGSVLVPSRFSRKYDCGVFDEPPTVLHVSRGLGGHHPIRFNCRPEIARLVLRRGKPGNAPA